VAETHGKRAKKQLLPRKGKPWVAVGETHGMKAKTNYRPWRGRTMPPSQRVPFVE